MRSQIFPGDISPTHWAFYIVCLGIVYGSLFPFQFSPDIDQAALIKFLGSWKKVSSSGDIIGNIALFIPFGLLGCMLPVSSQKHASGPVFVLLVWIVIAVGSQVFQLAVPSRSPSIFDLYGNAFGAILGWFLARFIPRIPASEPGKIEHVRLVPVCLIILWLAYLLIPFVPTIDFQSYKSAIKPLLLDPQWNWGKSLLEAACWLAFFYYANFVLGRRLKVKELLLGSLTVLLLKVIIVSNHVSLTGVVALGGVLILYALSQGLRKLQPSFFVWLLLVGYICYSIFPLEPRGSSIQFGWIPLSGFLQGSMLANSTALCQKLFVFGGISWLLLEHQTRFFRQILPIAFALLLVEAAQLRLSHGTPEITDPILFLAIATFLYRFRKINTPDLYSKATAPDQRSKATAPREFFLSGYISTGARGQVALIVGIYCVACTLLIRLMLQLPGVPYNVRELFLNQGSGVALVFFSLTLISFGWGAAWFGKTIANSHKPGREAQVALLKLSVVIFLLLWMSVTRESIKDITGSSVFVHRMVEREVLGGTVADMVQFLGRKNVSLFTNIFEPPIRFGALVGPLLIFMGVMFTLLFTLRDKQLSPKFALKRCGTLTLYLLPWLYFCKVIAFDWSSTDNLNELIERDGNWGMGGGGYLYALVFLISCLSVGLTWSVLKSRRSALLLVMVTTVSVPLGWFLLNQGLAQNVGKYGLTFSGVDFLLGPDRSNLISQSELFIRWFTVQMVAVVGLAFGALLYVRWSRQVLEDIVAVEKVRVKNLHINLRGSQAAFLNHLSSVVGINASEVFAQLIDLAVLPEAERNELPMHKFIDRYKAPSTRAGTRAGGWQRLSIYLDDTHIGRLESLAATSRASRSAALRNLLTAYKRRLATGRTGSKFNLLEFFHDRLPGGRPRRVIAIVGVLAVGIALLFSLLGRGVSIESAPHWGGDQATVILDHHTHTSYSDGRLTPEELVDIASTGGCDALVISDHADVSRALGDEQFQELQNLRRSYPELLLFAGVELNMPSYGGSEHVGLIADPSVEGKTLRNLRNIAEQTIKEEGKSGRSESSDAGLLQMAADFESLWGGLLLIYNHPSRSTRGPAESISNLTRWHAAAPYFSLMAGAPGHQNAKVTGSYTGPQLTVDRWDPAVAEIGGVWDQMLSRGYQIWAALASSDYHNERLDKAPCTFSRTHLAVPERSYRGVLKALRSGTFWADQGRILDQLWFTVGFEGLEQAVYPGSVVSVGDSGSSARVSLSIERGIGSVGSPLVVEIIGNCGTGRTEILAEYNLSARSSEVAGLIPLQAMGQDKESCFMRARVRLVMVLGPDLLAYTNPIRLQL